MQFLLQSIYPFSHLRFRVVARTLRFKEPAGTSRGVYTVRPVWYVVAYAEHEGRTAYGVGECAPLPDLSCDFSADYVARLRRICNFIEQTKRFPTDISAFSSIRFGLETALESLHASFTTANSFNLFPATDVARGLAGTPINGLVWMGSHEEMLRRMEQKVADGFRCIKIKIGAIAWDDELDLLRRLRRRFTPEELEIRVDANGAFAPDEALRKLQQLAAFQLHSIEQPIRAGQLDALAEVCRLSPVPIALDEELIGINHPAAMQQLLQAVRPQYIVLKPSLHGGVKGSKDWTEAARAEGVKWWMTSALESNVGLNAIARLQACLGGEPMAQGLGTGQLFVQNYGPATHIEHGRLWLYDERERQHRQAFYAFQQVWTDPQTPALTLQTSGSTGVPKKMAVEKSFMQRSAEMTLETLRIPPGASALICLPMKYVAGMMMAVRCFVGQLRPVLVAPCSRPLQGLRRAPAFAALTPMQVFETLQHVRERRLLFGVRWLIIGGGAVNESLVQALKRHTGAVFSTYGMTETLSHVALRRINGPEAEDCYRPLRGVRVTLDERQCLCIQSPRLPQPLIVTNDVGVLQPDGSFRVLGRVDNVVVSGGVKLRIEEIEEALDRLVNVPFNLTAVPDGRLGERLTMLYVGSPAEAPALEALCRQHLSRFAVPRSYYAVAALPRTATGKPDRAALRQLACDVGQETKKT